MDGRFATYRAIPETTALDHANDVLALSEEGRVYLVHAHSAHVTNDWAAYLDAVDAINRKLVGIRDVAHRWADEVGSAPIVCPDQLALPGHGFAA